MLEDVQRTSDRERGCGERDPDLPEPSQVRAITRHRHLLDLSRAAARPSIRPLRSPLVASLVDESSNSLKQMLADAAALRHMGIPELLVEVEQAGLPL